MTKTPTSRFFILAFVLLAPIMACDMASEPPKVIDTTSEIKKPDAPSAAPVKIKTP